MDWSFLANETCINVSYTPRTYNKQERWAILTRNNEQFLSYRVDGDCGCLDCPMICFHAFFSPTLASKNSVSIASHPSYGDVVKSKMISTGTNLKSFSRKTVEGYYSGEVLLGAFQISDTMCPGCCSSGGAQERTVLDAQSNPVMTFTSQMNETSRFDKSPTAFAKTEVFSQGENSQVVCSIQSRVDRNVRMNLFTETVGSNSTANFAAHLPIPIKICLIMRTAQAAQESYHKSYHAERG